MAGAPVSVCEIHATLGEGPVWVERDKALWFVDIKQQKVHRFDPADASLKSWDAPRQVSWILPADDGGLIAGLQDGLYRFDPGSGDFSRFAEVEPDRPGNRLNDACTDSKGRIWFGSMDDGESEITRHFYRYERGTLADSGLAPVAITNGPAVSPDGRLLYHTDTLGQVIHVSELGEDGNVGPAREFVRFAKDEGYPDGPVVDSEGCVWTGLYAGWEARRYAPDGRLLDTVRFPVANITKLAFGGPDLRTAFATTAAKGLSAEELARQPEAGNLFSFRVNVAGQAVTEVAS